jgi:hypothetical protein
MGARIVGRTELFGKPYLWMRGEDGRLFLEPDIPTMALFSKGVHAQWLKWMGR